MNPIIECGKLAKLLIIADNGMAGEFSGKRLQDITFEGENFSSFAGLDLRNKK